MKKLLALILIFLLIFSGCKKETVGFDYDFSKVAEKTMKHILDETPNPIHNHTGGEWVVICSALYGETAPKEWYDIYYDNLCETLAENDGVLSATKHTNYSRALLALSAMGKDPENVAGYNILDNYMSMENVTKQGLPGSIFALISLDSRAYEIPKDGDVTREKLIDYILNEEYPDGGWALIGDEPDVDITAQVIQSLAPYYHSNEKVTAAVDRAVNVLSCVQKPDGGYFAWEGENVQSAAQVVIALTAIGIDIRTDIRFIKSENWIGSYIMNYYLGNGAFCHTLGTEENQMATEQCMQALIAIEKFDSGKGRFYDFQN